MCLQEKIHFFLKAIFPTTTAVGKLCLFLAREITLGERHFCNLHDLKLLLPGRCLSCCEIRVFPLLSISSAQCLDYDGLPIAFQIVCCYVLQWGQEVPTTQSSDTHL